MKLEQNLTREQCIALLTNKFDTLGRLPKKSDFSDYEVMMIKSHLGPWPRALEAAGIKPPRDDSYLKKKIEKRERAKQRKSQYKSGTKDVEE